MQSVSVRRLNSTYKCIHTSEDMMCMLEQLRLFKSTFPPLEVNGIYLEGKTALSCSSNELGKGININPGFDAVMGTNIDNS